MPKRGRDTQSGRNRRRREDAEETVAALATQGGRNRRPRVMDDVGAETQRLCVRLGHHIHKAENDGGWWAVRFFRSRRADL